MSDPGGTVPETEHGWLYDHIGRIAGMVLLLIAFVFLTFLAAIGFKPAFGLVAFLVVGFVMIAVGGRLHGL